MDSHPYPGLRPFKRDENEIFFGREEQVDNLLEKLQDNHFIAVLGPSGCGKSSLVRTGVLNALESGFMAKAGASWAIADMHPGSQPFENLASALLSDGIFSEAYSSCFAVENGNNVIPAYEPFLTASLSRGPLSIHEILDGMEGLGESTLLLLVDQFEEIFRYTQTNAGIATDFVNLLLKASKHPQVYVIITMRSDFLGNAGRFQNLPEAINNGLFLTPRLTREQLADAIALPASLFGGEVKPNLVNYLLNEVGTSSDQLPLLQHALMRMWERDEDKVLTLEEYKTFGNLQQALNDHAEQAYQYELNENQRKLAEKIFRILTERSDKRDIRSPATLGELASVIQAASSEIVAIINVFRKPGRNFLTPPIEVDVAEDTVIDISHESLIRQWKRLQKWVNKEAEQVELYRRLEGAANRYAHGQGALLETPDLENALNWRDQEEPTVEWASRYGSHYRQVLKYLEESQRQKELKRYRKLRTFFIAFAVSVLTGLLGWGIAYKKIKQTEQLQYQALMSLVSSYSGTERFTQAKNLLQHKLDTYAGHSSKSDKFIRGMMTRQIEMMGQSPNLIFKTLGNTSYATGLTPDGRWLIYGDGAGNLLIYDLAAKEVTKSIYNPKVSNNRVLDIAIHPQGKWFVTSSSNGIIRFWSMPTDRHPPEVIAEIDLSGDKGMRLGRSLAIHPNGNFLAIGGSREAEIRDVSAIGGSGDIPISSVKKLAVRGMASEGSMAFSPNGKWLAYSTSHGYIYIWKTAMTGMPVILDREIELPDTSLAVTFSPDSKIIVAGVGHRILLWDVNTQTPLGSFSGHKDKVSSLQFVSAPQFPYPLLASASFDKTIRIFDPFSGTTLRVLQGHNGVVSLSRMAYQSERRMLFSSGMDTRMFGWKIDLPWQHYVNTGWSLASALAPVPGSDNKQIMVGYSTGAMQIYSLPEGAPLTGECQRQPEWPDNYCKSLKTWPLWSFTDGNLRRMKYFDQSGRGRLAIARNKSKQRGNLVLLDVNKQGVSETPLMEFYTSHDGSVWDLAVSKDKKYIATAGFDEYLKVVELETRQEVVSLKPDGIDVDSVDFDSHGHLIANTDDAIYYWDFDELVAAEKPKPLKQILPDGYSLRDMDISPDGRWLAAVGTGSSVELFPIGDEGLPEENNRTPLIDGEHIYTVLHAEFSQNSRLLATLGNDGFLQLWDVSSKSAFFHIRIPTNYLKLTRNFREFAFPCNDNGCYLVVPINNKHNFLRKALMIYDFSDLN